MERGCELIAHNYEQGELLTDFSGDEERERQVIQRTLDIYERTVGRKARGWLSSSLRGTLATPGILAEAGLLFYCDLMNDDQPYLIRTPHGNIVSTPYSNEINDFTILTRRGHTTDEFRDILIDELDELYREGRDAGAHDERGAASARFRARLPDARDCANSSSTRSRCRTCGGRRARRSPSGTSNSYRARTARPSS